MTPAIDMINPTDSERTLHSELMRLRNEVYAHSDSSRYSIKPWQSGDFRTTIEGSPTLRLTFEEIMLFQVMGDKWQDTLNAKLAELWP